MAQFCTQCGSEIKPGSKFCMVCGKKIEDDLVGNRVAQNVPNSAEQNKLTGKSNNKMIVALIVTLVVIGGICGYFFLGRSTGNINTAAEPQSNPTQQTQQATKPAENVPIPKETPKEEKAGLIIGVNVNARKMASTDSSVVGTFTLGEKVVILTEESEWAKVKRSDGQECYVFKKYLGNQAALDARQAKYNIKDGIYPVYLNGDPDYVLVYCHMGTAYYVVKSSFHYKPGTKFRVIKVVTVPDADKGSTKISSEAEFNYWFNDIGIEYWLNNNKERYLATLNGSGVQNAVAFTAYKVTQYITSGKVPSDGQLPQAFYDRLNP